MTESGSRVPAHDPERDRDNARRITEYLKAKSAAATPYRPGGHPQEGLTYESSQHVTPPYPHAVGTQDVLPTQSLSVPSDLYVAATPGSARFARSVAGSYSRDINEPPSLARQSSRVTSSSNRGLAASPTQEPAPLNPPQSRPGPTGMGYDAHRGTLADVARVVGVSESEAVSLVASQRLMARMAALERTVQSSVWDTELRLTQLESHVTASLTRMETTLATIVDGLARAGLVSPP